MNRFWSISFFFALFYILALIQIALAIPVVLVAFAAIVFFKNNDFSSLAAAVSAGLMFDVFSQQSFGFWIVAFLIARFLLLFMINSYVRLPLFFKQ